MPPGMAFGAIDFVLGALVLAALTMRVSPLARAARETAEPTPAVNRAAGAPVIVPDESIGCMA